MRIGAGSQVGGDDAVTLVGLQARLPDGAVIEAGGRYPDEG